jgi:hypothetical protein
MATTEKYMAEIFANMKIVFLAIGTLMPYILSFFPL